MLIDWLYVGTVVPLVTIVVISGSPRGGIHEFEIVEKRHRGRDLAVFQNLGLNLCCVLERRSGSVQLPRISYGV